MNSTAKKSRPASTWRRNHRGNLPFTIALNRSLFRLFGSYLPRLMSWWGFRLWSQTHRFEAPTREKRLQLRASECSLRLNDIEVKAWKWGNGPSVLLVHGWNGRGMQLGRLVDPLLSAGYQVITFDAPGHGQSGGTHTHLIQIRDAIIALSKQHGPLHAAVGHSFGVAALSSAVVAGVSIPNLVSISAPGGLSQLVNRYNQAMCMPDAMAQQLTQRIIARIGSSLWERFSESYPLTDNVQRTLIIHDKEDRLVQWQESERLSQCWPNTELLLTEGLGHRRILQNTKLANSITDFIDTPLIGDDLS